MTVEHRFTIFQLMLAVGICGCSEPSQPQQPALTPSVSPPSASASVWAFRECAAESGVVFSYENGEESGNYSILESLGGGLAVLDLDSDGLEDLCFSGGGTLLDHSLQSRQPGLFRNRGQLNFASVAEIAGISAAKFYNHGIARTDYDGDGFPDFLITGYGGVQLFRNCGDGTFELQDQSCGLDDQQWSSSGAWGDLNGDGHPDLYLTHYVDWSWENDPFCERGPEGGREICPPRSYTGVTDSVYLSNGDGTFQNATSTAGLSAEGKGLGVVICDLDGDFDNDIYVTNDTVSNFLYENDGTGVLQDVSLASGASLSSLGVPDGSMGVDVCDFNADAQPDLWVVNYERESNALYQNAGRLAFRHVSQRMGLNAVGGLFVGWGTCCEDFDGDGDEDIFVSNGHVIRYPQNAPLNQQPLLLQNESGKRLVNVTESGGSWFRRQHMGRGAVAADLDSDGDVDLAVSATRQPAALLENQTVRSRSRWLSVILAGTETGREPVGAAVILKTDLLQSGFLRGGGSYGSTVSNRLMFALPDDLDDAVLEIRWPDGVVQVIEHFPEGLVVIRESDREKNRCWSIPSP